MHNEVVSIVIPGSCWSSNLRNPSSTSRAQATGAGDCITPTMKQNCHTQMRTTFPISYQKWMAEVKSCKAQLGLTRPDLDWLSARSEPVRWTLHQTQKILSTRPSEDLYSSSWRIRNDSLENHEIMEYQGVTTHVACTSDILGYPVLYSQGRNRIFLWATLCKADDLVKFPARTVFVGIFESPAMNCPH